jgi:predicted dehydrogenase
MRQAATIAAGAFVVPANLLALERSALERLNIASIGVGGKGHSDCDQAAQYGNLVAICDIDDGPLDVKGRQFPAARKYHDYRKMFDDLAKEIDAVTVSTPDHSHAPASMMAMKLGKHVYCQKPLTWSVYEARALREAARKHGVCTQMGNQGTALDGFRTSIEVIRSGAIGPVREVHVWTDRCGGYWKQAPDLVSRPADRPAPPSHVHWDLFLGPAPERPYHSVYHPFAWRGWRDFGTGALGDMACHTANMAFMALKLGHPAAVSSEHSEFNPETFQQWATITYEFPARDGMPACKLVWWEGIRDGKRNLPPAELMFGEKPSNSGLLLVGDKGTLFSPSDYGQSFTLFPRKEFEGFKAPAPYLPRHGDGNNDLNQKKEWVSAIKMNRPELALANFDYSGTFTEAMLLGNLAIRAGQRIEWDGPNMKIRNAPAMEPYLHREYRRGWSL